MKPLRPGNTCLKALRYLPMAVAMALLAACGGGGGGGSSTGGSSDAYRLPYTLSPAGSSAFHLLNTDTLADSPRQERQIEALFPYQALADGRLVVMPASHVLAFDSSRSRFVRLALSGDSASFSFPANCEPYSYEWGDDAPFIPWMVMNCGTHSAPDFKLVDLMATSGDGSIGAADFTEVSRIELLAGTWDENGKPSGFIAAQIAVGDLDYRLFRYRSSDWANPEPLEDTDGNPLLAEDGFSLPGVFGDMAQKNQRLNIQKAAWLAADNGSNRTWYRVTWNEDEPQLEKAPPSIDTNGANPFVLNDGVLYYSKKSTDDIFSLYRLDKSGGVIAEQKLATASAAGYYNISILGFTPTRVIWFDRVNGTYATLKSTLLNGTGSASDTKVVWDDSYAFDSIAQKLFVHDETVYFSVWSAVSSHYMDSYLAQSNGSGGTTYLGEGVLFRAGFAGLNSGTAQDDGRLYRAHVDAAGEVAVASAVWPSTQDSFVTLGSAGGYTTQTCTDNLLWLKLALTPTGNQFMTINCAPSMGDGGFFWFKPGQAGSLTPLKPVAPLSDGQVRLLPSDS